MVCSRATSPLTLLPRLLFFTLPNFESLGTVIFQCLLEPRMLEGLLRRDAFRRVVDEDLLQEIEKLFVELIRVALRLLGNDVLGWC